MLRKTEPFGFLSGMLLPFIKCKESFGYVGLVCNYTQAGDVLSIFLGVIFSINN